MKLNDHKIQNGGVSTSNGNLAQESRAIDLRDAFEGTNGSVSTGSVSPVDTIPFNIEGIQTVIKNSQESSLKTSLENGLSSHDILSAELQRYKEENSQLRAALKEASRVNQQWRNYHDQRQGYEQKLLSSLQDLQQSTSLTQENGRSCVELQRLKEAFSKQQKEHNEHIQLLQLQVRAHRDDWEAERSEKKAAEFGRIQAEAQLQVLQRQLEEATALVADLEGRLKLCKCFGGCDGDTANNADKKVIIPFQYQNGTLPVIENTPRISPSFSSAASICSGTSRSSSVSKDLSACSSPTITKGLQLLIPHGGNAESSRTSSPSIRANPQKSSLSKPSESHHGQEKNIVENQSCPRLSPQIQQEEIGNTSSKSHQSTSDFGFTSKSRGSAKIKGDIAAESPVHSYESKGARPKTAGKSNDEEERQAKHRARSILASALPMSPSSSKPSSPVTVSSGKGVHIPKGYIPITSTVLTPVRFRHFTSEKKSDSEQMREAYSKTPSKSIAKTIGNSHSKNHDATPDKVRSSEQLLDTHPNKSDTSLKCKHSSSRKSSENLVGCNSNEQAEYRQCSSIQINGLTRNTTGTSDCNCSVAKGSSNGHKKSKTANEENSASKDGLDIKTATKMRQNTKSLIVTNNQQDKINTNYASITVMPGPSSALYSHTQTTSTTSSRSSSPGISLTTFALNANGQGVPGAIFFALGPEPKPSKSPQPQPNVSVLSSVASNLPQDEVNSLKNNSVVNKDSSEGEVNGRIVNSTWVQLMDKENNSTRQPSKTPWRTARAVPSHKLNSVRKIHSDDVTSNGMTTALAEGIRHEEHLRSGFTSGPGNKTVSNGHNNYLKPQNNYETRYQTSISPTPNFVSCSRNSPGISLSPPSYCQSNLRNGSSPTICIIPHSNCPQNYAEADLRSMASRNISSAILSYECANKGCGNLQGKKQTTETPSSYPFYTTSSVKSHPTIETSSEHCLICPSCQKLFPEDSPKYVQHLQECGGPKYADM